MKKYLLIGAICASLVLAGGSCDLQPLEPEEVLDLDEKTEQVEEKKKDDKKETKKKNDDADDNVVPDSNLAEDNVTEDKEDAVEENKEDSKDESSDDEEKTPSTETKSGSQTISAEDLDENEVFVMFHAPKADLTGDYFMEFGCEDVLIAKKVSLEKEQSDLAEAIVQLLVTKNAQYEDEGLFNAVAGSKLVLDNINYDQETGNRILYFTGDLTLGGACDGPRVKAQIEETARLYNKNFEIRLNDSAKEWECAFSEDDEC